MESEVVRTREVTCQPGDSQRGGLRYLLVEIQVVRVMGMSFVPIMSGSSINAIGEFGLIGIRHPSRVEEDSPVKTAQ